MKLTLITLLIVIVICQFGYYGFYAFKIYSAKECAREQMLQQIPENLLIKISAADNAKQMVWEEEGKEFKLNGELFDVVKAVHENGKEYLYCINDEKENELVKQYAKIIKDGSDNSSSDKNQKVAKFSIPEWNIESHDYTLENVVIALENKYFTYQSNLHCHLIEVISPPPNFILNN